MAKLSAQWAHDLAEEEFTKVITVQTKLETSGKHLADSQMLLKKSRDYINESLNHRRNGEYAEAYATAQRALRPLRILMRTAWEQALRDLDSPVATPYSISFFSLPDHYKFWEEIKAAKLLENVLPDGDFELAADKVPQGWVVQDVPSLDEINQTARRVTESARSGKQSLMLQITPKNPLLPPAALERAFLGIYSPAVKMQPGSLVRVSGWVKIPKEIKGSADGALFFDSAGGEPLGIRLTAATDWRHYTFYRRVPNTGVINVTLALTGLGTVYYDDWKIEPLAETNPPAIAVQNQPVTTTGIKPIAIDSQSKP
jgi:hypothetical protein